MDPLQLQLLDVLVKNQKKDAREKARLLAQQKKTARLSVAPVSKNYSYFVSSMLLLGLVAYVMAYFVMDDPMRYERGVGRTIPRVKVAAGILGVYIPWLFLYVFSDDLTVDTEGLAFLGDVAGFTAGMVLLNFVLTTGAYALTWYWSYIDYSEPNESFNMADVVDMRKVKMSVKHSYPCSMAEFEHNEFALRDYGTLQTIPLGTGTPPTENIASKLAWLMDVMVSSSKEDIHYDDSIGGYIWWGVTGVLGTVAAPFKFILQQFPTLNALLAVSPVFGAAGLVMFAQYFVTVAKLTEGQSDVVDFFGGKVIVNMAKGVFKFFAYLFLGFMFTSATTGSDIITTIFETKNAVCFTGLLMKFLATLFFALPSRMFVVAINSASPGRNVFPDFSYYSGTMTFLRENGFCTPYAWKTWLAYVWDNGELPVPSDDDEEMDKMIDEMESSPLAWPSTVARTALMHAYNQKKFVDNDESKRAWLDSGNKSVVLRHVDQFAPVYRKSEVLTVLEPTFYKNPYNFRVFGKDKTVANPNDPVSLRNQEEFMRFRREYVRDTIEKANGMFSKHNIRKHFVDFKKLGFDSSMLLSGLDIGEDTGMLDPLFVRDALWAFDDEDDKDTKREFAAGQYRMKSIVPFLSSTGSRNNSRVGIEGYNGITSGYCNAVFPGPPALVEDRQYRLNGYNGLFTLLPVWEGHNKYGSKTTWEYVLSGKWFGFPDLFLDNLEWDRKTGALKPKPGYE